MALRPLAPATRSWFVAALLLLTAASIGWHGYRFGESNHAIQIPILKHYVDPTLFARDPLMQAVEGYATYFFPAMAAVVRLAGDLETPYFVCYVAAQLATLAALFAIGLHVFGSAPIAAVACLLYLSNPSSLGGEATLFAPRLYHGSVATPILLAALLLHLRGRATAAMALCGLAFNIHSLHAAYVAAMLLADGLLRRRPDPRALLVRLAAFVLVSSPTLLWMARFGDPIPDASKGLWLRIMRERSGLHTFPSVHPRAYYGRYGLLAALGVLALWEARPSRWDSTVLRFLAAIAALCAVGVVCSEIVPVPVVIKAQLLRSTRWATLVFLVAIARLLWVAWRRSPLETLAVLAAACGFYLRLPAALAVSLLCFALALRRRLPGWLLALVVAAPLIALLTRALWPRGGLHLLDALARDSAKLSAAFVGVLLLALLLAAAAGRAFERGAALACIAVTCVWLLPAALRAQQRATAAEPSVELQSWLRAHTPRDAVILTPPQWPGFRVFSERSLVVEEKDGTQQFFSARFGFAWQARFEDVQARTKGLRSVSPSTLLGIQRDYGASFVVLPPKTPCLLPRLFANEAGSIHRIAPWQRRRDREASRSDAPSVP